MGILFARMGQSKRVISLCSKAWKIQEETFLLGGEFNGRLKEMQTGREKGGGENRKRQKGGGQAPQVEGQLKAAKKEKMRSHSLYTIEKTQKILRAQKEDQTAAAKKKKASGKKLQEHNAIRNSTKGRKRFKREWACSYYHFELEGKKGKLEGGQGGRPEVDVGAGSERGWEEEGKNNHTHPPPPRG